MTNDKPHRNGIAFERVRLTSYFRCHDINCPRSDFVDILGHCGQSRVHEWRKRHVVETCQADMIRYGQSGVDQGTLHAQRQKIGGCQYRRGSRRDRIDGLFGARAPPEHVDQRNAQHIGHTLDAIALNLRNYVIAQDGDIAVLKRKVAMLMEREAAREADGGVILGDETPPHY